MRRIFRVTLGFLLLLAGFILALPGVPGPGFVLVLLGLVLLSEHFHWARRSLEWAKEKAARAKERAGLGARRKQPET